MYATSLSSYLNKLADHGSCFAKEDVSFIVPVDELVFSSQDIHTL